MPGTATSGDNPRAIRAIPAAVGVRFTTDMLYVRLSDGREIGAPLSWFPRLAGATAEQREHWRPIGRGIGLHWPDVDEDISVAGLLGVSD
jgi:hypothetical protein